MSLVLAECGMDPDHASTPPSQAAGQKVSRLEVQTAREAGAFDTALTLIAQAKATQKRAPWPWIEEIIVLRDSGDRVAAQAAAAALLDREPRNARAWAQLGLLERAAGNNTAALTAFEQAHGFEPDWLEPVLQLSQETFALGQQEQSDAYLEKALALDTAGVQALSLAAQRAITGNDAATALPLFESAIARCPWHVNAYVGACGALVKLGRTDAAMQVLTRGIDQCGSRPVFHARRAQLLRDMGFYREAMEAAECGLQLHPGGFVLWEIGMRLRIMIGETEQMRSFLARAMPLRDADRATVAQLAGEMEAELGDPLAALAQYASALAFAPGASRMHGLSAVACLTAFDVDGAQAHLARQTEMTAPALRLKSRSDNPAQSYYGQIINEYRLDHTVRAAVAAASGAAELRVVCREFPDSTLAAAALLDASWRAGAWSSPRSGAARVPRRIAQYWDAAAPPADIQQITASWAECNPAFSHTLFDDLRARAFLHLHHGREILGAYHRATGPAMKADLFRLAWLYTEGGVYADADDRCVAPLEGLLPDGAALVLYREYLGTLGNNFLAAAPGHPVIATALAGATEAINRGDQELLWLATGPGLITRSFAAHADLAETQVWSRREMLRHVAIHCLAGYKDTAAHWVRAAFQERST